MGGESPISFSTLDRYATRYGIAGTQFEIFVALVSEMDSEYLEHRERVARAEEELRKTRPNA